MNRIDIFYWYYLTRDIGSFLLMTFLTYILFRNRADVPKRAFVPLFISCVGFAISNAFYAAFVIQKYFWSVSESVATINIAAIFVIEITDLVAFAVAVLRLIRRDDASKS
jgi:hypothetical protein